MNRNKTLSPLPSKKGRSSTQQTYRTKELSKDELYSYINVVGQMRGLPYDEQVGLLSRFIDEGDIHLKINGHVVDHLQHSHFKNLDLELQKTLIYATFDSEGYDQIRILASELSLDQIFHQLEKPIDITWVIPDEVDAFRRISFGFKVTQKSPTNPQVIHVLGRKL
jgi:hypothetical protein